MPFKLCFGGLLFASLSATAQTVPADTSRVVTLPAATVTGYGQHLPLQRTAAGVSVIDGSTLAHFAPASLATAVNTLPGVRMEERATASYRLSIRGSTLRSPFGVRNVKVYYQDMPFTEASGSTPLNILDQGAIGRVEVVKGPSGSVYGAGTGGVVLLENQKPAPGKSGDAVEFTVGSFGLRRFAATAETAEATGSYVRAQYARQTLEGYRQNSGLRREVLTLDGALATTERDVLSVHMLYTDLAYQLPGGLTRLQFNQNPQQARPGTATLPGTVAQKASYSSQTMLVGATHEHRFSERWASTLILYGTGALVNTPYLVDFERNTMGGGGGRATVTYLTTLARRMLKITAGGEGQASFENGRSYQNREGMPGPLRYDDEISTRTGFLFVQAAYELPAGMLLTVGGSYNGLCYNINRLTADSSVSRSYAFARSFRPEVSPRVALLKEFTPQLSAYASISTGFSPPTDEEIRPSDGSINQSLQAERGTSYEVGIRGTLLRQRLHFDVAFFDFELRQTIVSRSNAQGTQLFANAGTTHQRGMEAALSSWLWQPNATRLATAPLSPPGLRVWTSYAYNHFRFGNYQFNALDFSGHDLTGTAPHTLSAGLDLQLLMGFYFYPVLSHQARLPLNDANTDYASGYWTFGARTGWRRALPYGLVAEVYVGIDNATNRHYSLGYDLNAFGSRYFQAAPGRSTYSGAQLRWHW